MKLFKKYGLMLLMLVMVAQAQQSVLELYMAASKGDPDALAQLKTLGNNKGNAAVQLALGSMYANGNLNSGIGAPKDAAQAVFWYRKSAEQGFVDAQYALGLMYFRGEGVPKDLVIAYMWENLAAAKGDEDAKKARENLEALMTPAQIAEAQKMSREWKPKP